MVFSRGQVSLLGLFFPIAVLDQFYKIVFPSKNSLPIVYMPYFRLFVHIL